MDMQANTGIAFAAPFWAVSWKCIRASTDQDVADLLFRVSYTDTEAGRLISVFAGELAKRSLMLSIQPVFFCYQASYD